MFEFRVKFYADGESQIECGLIGGAETYTEAMKELTDYYGDDMIEECSVTCISDSKNILIYNRDVTTITTMIDII